MAKFFEIGIEMVFISAILFFVIFLAWKIGVILSWI
jgi:hypothetical protein